MPCAITLIVTALRMCKRSWLLMTRHWMESQVFVLSSKTFHSLLSVPHSSPCSHWCLGPVYTSPTVPVHWIRLPPPSSVPELLLAPLPDQRPFIKCLFLYCLEGNLARTFTFYREGHLLHNVFLAKNIPALSSKFFKHFACISPKPGIFHLHYRFSSNHDDCSWGAASIFTRL